MELQIQVIRSRRKTLSMQIKEGKLVVKAPLSARDEEIRRFVQKHEQWIETHMEKEAQTRNKAAQAGRLTREDIQQLADRACREIPPRVQHYAAIMGVTYGRITIRNQKTRWGSCSRQGNLNFNCLLMLCPLEVVDSVIVHELAHRKEMNHSPRFYAEVLKVFPDYWRHHEWLKKNGSILIQRMTG